MGWIAVAAGTLVVAAGLYTFVTRYADHDLRPKTVPTQHAEKEPIDSKSKPSQANDHIAAPDTVLESPTITPPDEPIAPSISMPPPPPRPPQPTLNTMPPPPTPPPTLKPRTASPPRLKPPSMGPPPRPTPSSASTLRVPTTRALTNTHMQPATSTLPIPKSKSKSRAVVLAPGYSPLDWAALTTSTTPASLSTLRGHDAPSDGRLLKIPPSQLRRQNGRKGKDAWTSYQGKVYNISAYMKYHPGGEGELMRAAGREGGGLFMEVHPWVNWEGMLSGCVVGVVVAEGEGTGQKDGQVEGGLDEMD